MRGTGESAQGYGNTMGKPRDKGKRNQRRTWGKRGLWSRHGDLKGDTVRGERKRTEVKQISKEG